MNQTEQLIRRLGGRLLHFLGGGWIYVDSSGIDRRLQYFQDEETWVQTEFRVDELADCEALANALASDIKCMLEISNG